MIPAVFAIPGDINLQTGGYIYDRRVMALLPQFGVAVRHMQLPGSFPDPSVADLEQTRQLLATVTPDCLVMVDGLAYGAMTTDVIARIRAPVVALVHHPLCLEAGVPEQRQRELRTLETAALTVARRVLVTSRVTARTLIDDFAVPADKISVAEPGTDPALRATGSPEGAPLQLLSVGAIVPRKAADLLVRALAALQDEAWRLVIAGPTDRSPQALSALRAAISETGIGHRITLTGSLRKDQLAGYFRSADAFVIASLYEGYGMVLAEAMSYGLPIVCTTGGAAAETVPNDAAIKVPPGDLHALSSAIRRTLQDRGLRRHMADTSWAAGQKLPRWEETASIVAEAIKEVTR